MAEFKDVRHVAEAGKAGGLTPETTRAIADGSLFAEADGGVLGLLKESLSDESRRAQLLDMFGARSAAPSPLYRVIEIFDRFSAIKEKLRGAMTPEDISFLNLSIAYLQDWFLRGAWTHIPEEHAEDAQAYAYFSAPAMVVNTLTKIKEIPEYAAQMHAVDPKELAALMRGVAGFSRSLISERNLVAVAQSGEASEQEREHADIVLGYLDETIDAISRSEASVKREIGANGHPAGDLYFLKTCLIAAEILRRQRAERPGSFFIPDIRVPSGTEEEYIAFDFSQGNDARLNSMHYSKSRLPYCMLVVEYLRSKAPL